jgi:FAD/FMN-containing dehydrogenase
VDTPGESGKAEADALAAAMTGAGALWAAQSTDDAEAEALFDARRLAYPALERLGPVAFTDFLDPAIELGGTVSGEHGIGLLKRDGMRRELDPGALAMQEAVRRALDPRGLFNPGKG